MMTMMMMVVVVVVITSAMLTASVLKSTITCMASLETFAFNYAGKSKNLKGKLCPQILAKLSVVVPVVA